MKLLIVTGSQRKNAESARVGQLLCQYCIQEKVCSQDDVSLWDLSESPLPFWDVDMWNADSKMRQAWTKMSKVVREADGLVLVVPEWAGIAPPAIKNFLLFCSGGELAHKPALIVAVSSSRGGAYPIAELRMSGFKNSFVCYIPDQLIIRDVASFPDQDSYMVERSKYALRVLREYMSALKSVRESGVVNLKEYPYGM